MRTTLALTDFDGRWHMRRRIEDRRAGQAGRFEGHATFTVRRVAVRPPAEVRQIAGPRIAGHGGAQEPRVLSPQVDHCAADYHEAGHLILGDAPPLRAERRYLWRQEGAEIAVFFADGRPFHDIDPDAGPDTEVQHLCGADLYSVRYDFARWPDWQARWTVRGPAKDYTMTTDYARGRGPSG